MAFDGSYPAPPGNKLFSVADIPITSASYTQIVQGTPPTGGLLVQASTFGLKSIEWAQCTGSDNGQYDAVVLMNPFNVNQPSPSFRLQVLVSLTGAEVAGAGVIAAGRYVRVFAMGTY